MEYQAPPKAWNSDLKRGMKNDKLRLGTDLNHYILWMFSKCCGPHKQENR